VEEEERAEDLMDQQVLVETVAVSQDKVFQVLLEVLKQNEPLF
jgi:hypothetical protein